MSDQENVLDAILSAIKFGHVELVRRLMTIRDGEFVGFYCGDRMCIPASFCFLDSELERSIIMSNSPAMYDIFIEVKVHLDIMQVCDSCIRGSRVDMLRHIFPRLDARAASDALCAVPELAVSMGAIDILDLFVEEMKMIQVKGSAFVVACAGHYREVPFEVAWLKTNLLEVVTWLERHGIQIAFSRCIGYHLLYDSNPGFMDYLEQKGYDYLDLVGENDLKKLIAGDIVKIHHKWQLTFYDKLFRDRRILEMLSSDLTRSLIGFIGSHERDDPGVLLPLVRLIYDQAPWRHTLPHPFELMVNRFCMPTEESMHFVMDFSWTSQIDPEAFFERIRKLGSLKTGSHHALIMKFIAMKMRDGCTFHFTVGILNNLISTRDLTLKELHEILLVMPPLRDLVEIDLIYAFLDLNCQSGMEIDSFMADVEWIMGHLGDKMASWSDAVAMKYIAMCHKKVLPGLLDLGLPMPSKSSLAVLYAIKKCDPVFSNHWSAEEENIKGERKALGKTLEKLRVLKQRGADFPASLLCEAFDTLRCELLMSRQCVSLPCSVIRWR